MFKVNNKNTGKRYEIFSKLTVKTPEQLQWRRSGVFIVDIKHVLTPFSSVSIVDFEQVNVSWEHGQSSQKTDYWVELNIFKVVQSW